jgi:hypothetical protein
VHIFVDRDSQCTGPYAHLDPLAALAQRWMRDARKTTVSGQLLNVEVDDERVPKWDAVSRTRAVPRWAPGQEGLAAKQPDDRAHIEEDRTHIPKRTAEVTPPRALAHELAVLETDVWSHQPANEREFSDGLDLDLW